MHMTLSWHICHTSSPPFIDFPGIQPLFALFLCWCLLVCRVLQGTSAHDLCVGLLLCAPAGAHSALQSALMCIYVLFSIMCLSCPRTSTSPATPTPLPTSQSWAGPSTPHTPASTSPPTHTSSSGSQSAVSVLPSSQGAASPSRCVPRPGELMDKGNAFWGGTSAGAGPCQG